MIAFMIRCKGIIVVGILAITLFAGNARSGDCPINYILVFHRYVALNNNVLQTVHAGYMAHAEGQILENYVDNIVDPTLEKLKEEICVTRKCKDQHVEILYEMLKMLVATSNVANETPTYILGDIYFCRPDLLISAYGKLPENQRVETWKSIELGLEMRAYYLENDSPEYMRLKRKLYEIRPRWH